MGNFERWDGAEARSRGGQVDGRRALGFGDMSTPLPCGKEQRGFAVEL